MSPGWGPDLRFSQPQKKLSRDPPPDGLCLGRLSLGPGVGVLGAVSVVPVSSAPWSQILQNGVRKLSQSYPKVVPGGPSQENAAPRNRAGPPRQVQGISGRGTTPKKVSGPQTQCGLQTCPRKHQALKSNPPKWGPKVSPKLAQSCPGRSLSGKCCPPQL